MKIKHLKMKLSVFLTFFCVMQITAATGFGQEKINIDVKNASLDEILEEIKVQTDYRFFFEKGVINLSRKMSLKVRNETVENVLGEMFRDSPISFTILKDQIVFTRKPPERLQTLEPAKGLSPSPLRQVMPSVIVNRLLTVTGTVTDRNGNPLIGVNIQVKGTTRGTVTDFDGGYSIDAGEDDVLIFSYVGYQVQELGVNGQTEINVQMTEDAETLDELVVVGYGVQKKENLTGSVSSINGDDLKQRPVSNSVLALQGVAPGLNITNRGGVAGNDDVTIRIRGTGTLNNADPLVIVDGIPQSMSDIPASEIESISVLKDAASASIYGARAGNGVILVTTKRGIDKGVKISYNSYAGVQSKIFWPDIPSVENYLSLQNEAYENAGQDPLYSEEYIENAVQNGESYKYPFTDWREVVFNENAFQHNHSLNVSVGGKIGKFSLSGNFLDQDAIINKHNYKRYSLRLNSTVYMAENLDLTANLMFRNRNYSGVGRSPGVVMQSLLVTPPSNVALYPNGSTDLALGNNWNPYAMIYLSGEHEKDYMDLIGTIGLDYEILENLKIKGTLGFNNSFLEERLYRNKLEMNDYFTNEPVPVGSWWSQNYLEDSRLREFEPNYQVTLNYEKSINDNHFKILSGYQETGSKVRWIAASRESFYNNRIRELDGGGSENWKNNGSSEEWRLRSFFGRINYDYKEKYLLEANVRYDGSSRFSIGNKYGTFPSFSAGWRITEEPFLQRSQFLNNLKIRASWGALGNQDIQLYRNVGVYDLGQTYNFNNQVVVGASQIIAPNEDITWESTKMTNLGLDIELFNGSFSLTADYFWRKTVDILLELPIAPSLGISPPVQNAGIVSNKGWEIDMNYSGSFGKFDYFVGLDLSDFINRIEDLKGTGPYLRDKFNIWQRGYSINALYGYKSMGIYRTKEDLEKYPKINPQVTLGDIIYEDINEDGKINSEDRVIIGNSDPRYAIGLNAGFKFRGFDFNMFWQGVLKVNANMDGHLIEGPDWENYITKDMADNRYHETRNPNGSLPRVSYGNTWNILVSDFWMQDTKYLRLKNFQIGYSLNKKILKSLNIDNLRIYLSGENQITFTDAKWVDPEFPNGRLHYAPQSKTVILGVNLSF